MRTVVAVSMLSLLAASLPAGDTVTHDSLYSFKTTTLQGKPADLAQFSGKVTLVVNVANFAKYLVGKDGKVIRFFDSKVTPESPELRQAIDAAVAR